MSKPIITVENLTKTFTAANGVVDALHDISFSVNEKDIFGIIGLSGAGKSTLVRCMNLLEEPTTGKVIVKDKDLLALSKKELRLERQKIGMIFQHFNLLEQRNVIDNVCFPLEIRGVSKGKRVERARELLRIVGLEDKEKAYPAQLSGGQKQRVAIARVLANDPDILLCDEATSSLDPQTTQTILELLQKINEQSGITVVVITHEMRVIKQICNHVAVLHKGVLKETGTVKEVFEHPKTSAAKRLVYVGLSEEENEEQTGGAASA